MMIVLLPALAFAASTPGPQPVDTLVAGAAVIVEGVVKSQELDLKTLQCSDVGLQYNHIEILQTLKGSFSQELVVWNLQVLQKEEMIRFPGPSGYNAIIGCEDSTAHMEHELAVGDHVLLLLSPSPGGNGSHHVVSDSPGAVFWKEADGNALSGHDRLTVRASIRPGYVVEASTVATPAAQPTFDEIVKSIRDMVAE